jgi:purine-binding chemotaxis protein CheW
VHRLIGLAGDVTAPVAATQLVTFRLGDDLFAADIFAVERVLRYAAPTSVPDMPQWIDGVVDYQGRVVPVVNLRRRFSLPDAPMAQGARILVFTIADEWVAACVDGVLDVSAVEPSAMAPPPPLFRGLAAAYLRGIVRRGDRLVIVLDVAKLLAATGRIVLERATTDAAPGA